MKKMKRIVVLSIMISVIAFIYSCEKKEPSGHPEPNDVMKKITQEFKDFSEFISLSEKTANEMYSDKNDDNIDLSKIEKYSVMQSQNNSASEIGIFKLYDKVNADYVKDMANNRILKMQKIDGDNNYLETVNNAEARSYGNYVYYVSHSKKDKIFQIIENALRES